MPAIDPQLPPHARWRTSSHSSTGGGQCVEVADAPAGTWLRDSRDPQGAVLAFGHAAWAAFVEAASGGRL
ncbi:MULTISPECIES: DUF397 domain-containing protein [Nocardiopsis]|uniref:DUF397 domain-containing protein n=1 Tax=Nocardiopsis TaxID=2013 RepID=UPI000344A32F|nr:MULTISPECIES: DUF397 domain-containing protein [Nocardiopsis]